MKKSALLFALAVGFAAFQARADYALAYHGKLVAADGFSISTKVPMQMEFRLYDSASSTTPLWGRRMSVRFLSEGGNFYTELRDSSGTALEGARFKNLADAAAAGGLFKTLDWLDAPAGSYVDTGVKPNQDTRVVMDVAVKDSNTREYWFGAWDNRGNGMHQVGAFAVGNDDGEVYSATPDRGGGNGDELAAGRTTIDFSHGVLTVTTNGVSYTHTDWHDLQTDRELKTTFQLENAIWLFVQNRKGEAQAGDGQVSIRLHSCQIYDGDTLVRDYVPVQYGSEVCLYDQVNGAYAMNKGSGAFEAGPVVSVDTKSELYLGLTPVGYAELSPRQSVGIVPRAERVGTAQSADKAAAPAIKAADINIRTLAVGGDLTVSETMAGSGFTLANTITDAGATLGSSSGGVTFTSSFDNWTTTTDKSSRSAGDVFQLLNNSGIGVYAMPDVPGASASTAIRQTFFTAE